MYFPKGLFPVIFLKTGISDLVHLVHRNTQTRDDQKMIITGTTLYKSLLYLNIHSFQPGQVHQLLKIEPRSTRDVNRISTNLKYLCGAYPLQSNRAAYNKTEVSPTCQLCGEGDEDLEHFILNCSYLESEIKMNLYNVSAGIYQKSILSVRSRTLYRGSLVRLSRR